MISAIGLQRAIERIGDLQHPTSKRDVERILAEEFPEADASERGKAADVLVRVSAQGVSDGPVWYQKTT